MNRLVLFLWIVLNFASVYSWTRWGSRKTTQHRHRTTAAVNLSSLSQEDISVSNHVLDALLTYRAVCLDVDSTVLCEEGIDELARMKGLYDQIAVLNTRSMSGKMLYQDSLKQSLDMLRPSKADIDLFLGSRSTIPLSPGVQVLVKLLHTLNKDVYLVSGGFTQLIDPVADLLHIPRNNVFAIRLQFDSFTGEYNGYDETAPTSREHGKSIVVQSLLTERYASFPQTGIVMIGDGNNDLQAKPPASLFIGYGGNIVREHVKQRADWFITDFQDLIDVLHKLHKLELDQ